MISTKAFYSQTINRYSFVTKHSTVDEVILLVESLITTNGVLLPPQTGNQKVDKDVEDISKNFWCSDHEC